MRLPINFLCISIQMNDSHLWRNPLAIGSSTQGAWNIREKHINVRKHCILFYRSLFYMCSLEPATTNVYHNYWHGLIFLLNYETNHKFIAYMNPNEEFPSLEKPFGHLSSTQGTWNFREKHINIRKHCVLFYRCLFYMCSLEPATTNIRHNYVLTHLE